MLCKTCNGILTGKVLPPNPTNGNWDPFPPDDPAWGQHYSSFGDVQASAKGGCRLCYELWIRAEADGLPEDTQYIYRIEQKLDKPPEASSTRERIPAAWITFKKKPLQAEDHGYVLGLWMINEPSDPSRLHAPAAFSGDEASFKLIEKWMSACLKHHPACKVSNPNNWRPTRLIHLLSPTQGRIIETREVSPQITDPYISLSHCWGNHRPTTLDTERESEMKAGFDISILPKTFRDVVHATWRLGVRYLWIDSLCILQDSEEDWRNESATMGDVYRFAHLNLGATRASDSMQGMYHTRNTGWVDVPRVTLQFENCEPVSCLLGDEWSVYKLYPQGPLMPRGWVLQERSLSPRMVHFDTIQMHWQCREGESNEMHASATLDDFHTGSLNPKYDLYETIFKPAEQIENPGGKISDSWSRVVDEYSRLHLTFSRDKLVAISGMASLFSKRLNNGDQYLAGLWKSQLPRSLLWHCEKPSIRPTDTYQAPSWSWASVEAQDGGIEGFYGTRTCAELVSARVDLLDESKPFGQVTGGRITLFAPVVHMRFSSWGWIRGAHMYRCMMPSISLETNHHDLPKARTSGYGKFHLDEKGFLSRGEEVYVLFIKAAHNEVSASREEKDIEIEFAALLVSKVRNDKSEDELWKRVGYMDFAVGKEKGDEILGRKELWKDITMI